MTYETVRQWCLKFGQTYANELRPRRPRCGDKWHLDEVVLTIRGKKYYLWRAVDQHGNVLDMRVAEPTQQTGSEKILSQAAQRGGICPTCDHYRQTGELWGCQARDSAWSRASAAEAAQQSGRELAPIHTVTRARKCGSSNLQAMPNAFFPPLVPSLDISSHADTV